MDCIVEKWLTRQTKCDLKIIKILLKVCTYVAEAPKRRGLKDRTNTAKRLNTYSLKDCYKGTLRVNKYA